MANAAFDYRYFINAPAYRIYAHLAQPENYVGLSPLVVAVSEIEQGADSAGIGFFRYRSVERFHFLGLIRYDNLLRVTITLTKPNQQMISEVDSPFSVNVRFIFDFEPGDGGTWIVETISAQMPLIVKG
ncbi:MAG: SRPBCC family protein, partial [Chloroflexota bacterium]